MIEWSNIILTIIIIDFNLLNLNKTGKCVLDILITSILSDKCVLDILITGILSDSGKTCAQFTFLLLKNRKYY